MTFLHRGEARFVRDEAGARLECGSDVTLTIQALAAHVLDVRLHDARDPAPHERADVTMLAVDDGQAPLAGDPCEVTGGDGWLETPRLRVEVEAADLLRTTVYRRGPAGWVKLLQDRPAGAWFDGEAREGNGAFRHYQTIEAGSRHYGLGDKTGPLDRTGRRFRTVQLDALGYDAERSDPLYKHAPFLMAEHEGGVVGMLYDTFAPCTFDVGREHSNYFPRYRYVSCDTRPNSIVLIAGARVRDVVPTFYALTGRTFMPPRWALGFAFTSMHHADAEDAPNVIRGFAAEARARKLPISAVHLGSGYALSDAGQRLTFEWNERRFGERAAMFAALSAMGFRTVANVKPVLHETHPCFKQAKRDRLFVGASAAAVPNRADTDEPDTGPPTSAGEATDRSSTYNPTLEPFWDGRGAQLDFTNPDTVAWWRGRVRDAILEQGFDAVWNDNNEAELTDTAARVDMGALGVPGPRPALGLRPIHALQMAKASYEETLRTDPQPHNITRAGPIGICRYAETWTGDNVTSWHTLRWNLRQGLSMSLSGFPLVGHDVGGFVGPSPDAELLVRWFQMMALHPRCVMNSWKPETGRPNLPWMHEETFDHVRAALELRYRFLPVLEREVRRAHEKGEPVIAPVLYHCDDPEAREDMDAFMLGRDLLVLPVVEKGAREGRGWTPSDGDWIDVHTGERHRGGAIANVPAPLERLALLARAGTSLRLATAWPDDAPHEPLAFEDRRF